MKKKWYVREEQVIIETWSYEVEAATAEEAKELVKNGDVEPNDHTFSYELGEPIKIVEVSEIDEE